MVPYPSSQGRIRKHQCPAFRWFIDLCQLLCWFPINSWICICQVGIVSRLNKIGKRRSWVTNYIDSFFFVLLFCFVFFFFLWVRKNINSFMNIYLPHDHLVLIIALLPDWLKFFSHLAHISLLISCQLEELHHWSSCYHETKINLRYKQQRWIITYTRFM